MYPLKYKSALFKSAPAIDQPLGILYVAGMLEAERKEVLVYDSLIDPDDMMHPMVEKNGLIEFGASIERVEAALRRTRPDIVGISNMFSTQVPTLLRTAEMVRRALPTCTIVVGGAHVTAAPDAILEQSPQINYVVRGEGEYSFLELVDSLEKTGTYTGRNPAIIGRNTPPERLLESFQYILDLDKVPMPAYHLVDMELYFHFDRIGFPSRMKLDYPGSDRTVTVITSRGCPYGCTFCSVRAHMGRRLRAHSIPVVIQHLTYLKEKYGVRHIHFEDDIINLPEQRMRDILSAMIKQNLQLTWDTPNGLRAEGIDKEMLDLAKRSGCIYLIMGVESGDQHVVKKVIKKALDLSIVEQAARNSHENGVDMGAFFILGFTEETKQDLDTTVNFALRMKTQYGVATHVHLLTPVIGTELYLKAQREQQIPPQTYDPLETLNYYFSEPVLKSENFTKKELQQKYFSLERKLMMMAVTDILRFSLRHPLIALRVIAIELAHVLKGRRGFLFLARNLYLRHFLYKHALLRCYRKGSFWQSEAPDERLHVIPTAATGETQTKLAATGHESAAAS